jgi:hypothetical protein
LNYFTLVVVVNVSVVVETTTSASVVGASLSVTEVVALDVSAASPGVSTSGDVAATLAGSATATTAGRVIFALFKATVGRSETARVLVALPDGRLDTELQRCLPQHRMIQKRTFRSSAHKCLLQ